jgi:hypothetical protein
VQHLQVNKTTLKRLGQNSSQHTAVKLRIQMPLSQFLSMGVTPFASHQPISAVDM